MESASSTIFVSRGPSVSKLHYDPSHTLLFCVCGVRHVFVAANSVYDSTKGSGDGAGIVAMPSSYNPASGAQFVADNKNTWHITLVAGDAVYIPYMFWHAIRAGKEGGVAIAFEVHCKARTVMHHVGVGIRENKGGWASARQVESLLNACTSREPRVQRLR